jgi:hypothetical protein
MAGQAVFPFVSTITLQSSFQVQISQAYRGINIIMGPQKIKVQE